jgi:hypothetical protein
VAVVPGRQDVAARRAVRVRHRRRAHAVAARVLGGVEREVGVGDPRAQGVVLAVERCRAHAHHGADRLAAPFERQARHVVADALGRVERAQRVGVRQEDDELVAAEAAEQVGLAQRGGDRTRDLAQHQVAGQVSVQVVDALEVIDVNHQHRRRHRVAPAARPFTVGQHQELAPVVGAGQVVARGQHVQPRASGFGIGPQAQQRPGDQRSNDARAGQREQGTVRVDAFAGQPAHALAQCQRTQRGQRRQQHGRARRTEAEQAAAQTLPLADVMVQRWHEEEVRGHRTCPDAG